MISNISSTPPPAPPSPTPKVNADGTISAIVLETSTAAAGGTILRLWLPLAWDTGGGFGRYFLVRCVEDNQQARAAEWSIYARRPLFCTALPSALQGANGSAWEFLIPTSTDAGYQWLARRPVGTSLNVAGPLGQPFTLASTTRALLVMADSERLSIALPVIHTMLDRGGRVLLIVKDQTVKDQTAKSQRTKGQTNKKETVRETDTSPAWLALIPIPVETRIVPAATWIEHLEQPARWADQLCAALPPTDYVPLANALRTIRFRLDADFAHVFFPSDLLCGVGACLACVVPTREGGFTRACVNGPVFPLTTLA